MTLFAASQGSGPDIVLVHGWGLPGQVWDETARRLSTRYRVTVIDLPGYASSPYNHDGCGSLAALARQVAAAAPPQALWIGWSLGGLIALQIALDYPERVKSLVLVASTARFTQAPDWPHAVAVEVLDDFARDLTADYRATIRRFLALQARGSEHARADIHKLAAHLAAQEETSIAALQDGLNVLRDSDLRARAAAIRCPVLLILGERDTLVPLAVDKALASLFQMAYLHTIKGAAHAPFLSHPQEFIKAVSEFLDEKLPGHQRAGHASAG